jgi:predicted nuclease with TOPRIM domain
LQQQCFAQQQRAQQLEIQYQLKTQALQGYEDLQSKYEKCVQNQEEITREHMILNERYAQVEKISQQQAHELEQKRIFNQALEKQNTVLAERLSALEKNLNHAEDKIEALRQEKLFLIQEKAEIQGRLPIRP